MLSYFRDFISLYTDRTEYAYLSPLYFKGLKEE